MSYFVTLAPGHYGDKAPVLSTHHSLEAAKRVVRGKPNLVVREGHHFRKGGTLFRASENLFPIAFRWTSER